MKHIIDNESFYPWTDIKNGRYDYWEKRYNCKLTEQLLEQAVEKGTIKTREVQVEGTPFSFTVFNEADIITGLAWHKFKVKIDTEQWFK